jgi:hypothetical protein
MAVAGDRPNPGARRKLTPVSHDLICWKCGTSLAQLSLPLRRLDECSKCRAELHVCRMCGEYDTRIAKHCREPTAEEVSNKTQANFCDHFKPRPAAYTAPNTAEVDKSKSELERLFGKR